MQIMPDRMDHDNEDTIIDLPDPPAKPGLSPLANQNYSSLNFHQSV